MSVLEGFKEAGIVTLAFPSHLSHILQPLDVSAFYSYVLKHYHQMRRKTKVLNAFQVCIAIRDAYETSFTSSNIISGLYKSGVWSGEALGTVPPA